MNHNYSISQLDSLVIMILDSGLNWFSKLSFVAHSTSHIDSNLSIQNHETDEGNISILAERSNLTKDIKIPPPRDFIRICRNGEWTLFVEKCRKEPSQLLWVGPHGQNLLHLICTRRPNGQSIIEFTNVYPEALLKEDKDGCLPIHMAMTNGASHQVICLLISKAPKSILHENKWNYHPFDWIWRRCKFELMHSEIENLDEEEEIWNTIEVMIEAASLQSGSLQHGTILHKAMDFNCPIDLVECIISKFPSMAISKDSLGRTPLARAVSSPQSPSKELIQVLLQIKNSALIIDDYGRTPFHSAIISQIQWNEGLREIFVAAPSSLLLRDEVTNLYPYQLIAKCAYEEDSNTSLTDIYEILCLCPALVSFE